MADKYIEYQMMKSIHQFEFIQKPFYITYNNAKLKTIECKPQRPFLKICISYLSNYYGNPKWFE